MVSGEASSQKDHVNIADVKRPSLRSQSDTATLGSSTRCWSADWSVLTSTEEEEEAECTDALMSSANGAVEMWGGPDILLQFTETGSTSATQMPARRCIRKRSVKRGSLPGSDEIPFIMTRPSQTRAAESNLVWLREVGLSTGCQSLDKIDSLGHNVRLSHLNAESASEQWRSDGGDFQTVQTMVR